MLNPYPGNALLAIIDGERAGRPAPAPSGTGAPTAKKPLTIGNFLQDLWEQYSKGGYVPPGGRPKEVPPGSDTPAAAAKETGKQAAKAAEKAVDATQGAVADAIQGAVGTLGEFGRVFGTNLFIVALILIGVWMLFGGGITRLVVGGDDSGSPNDAKARNERHTARNKRHAAAAALEGE